MPGSRRNPADDIEELVSATVSAWLGDRGVLIDTSRSNGPDFRIDYDDGRAAIGEASWHTDPSIEQMWSTTLHGEKPQQIEIRPGSGQWSVKLIRGARIDRLPDGLQEVIDGMLASGQVQMETWSGRSAPTLVQTARRYGIEYLSQVTPEEPSVAVFFMPSQPGAAIPQDPNVIAEWAEQVLADSRYLDVTAKLLRLDADERHVFLMTGSLTDYGVEERLRRLDQALPTRDPVLPVGINHLWLAPPVRQ